MTIAPLQLSVATYNIHKGFPATPLFARRPAMHALREQLQALNPDIVFLQEVVGAHAGHAARHSDWPAESQYEYLADRLWQSHAYGKNAVYDAGHHGNALLSRYPITRWDNEDVSTHRFERRGLLHCVLEAPDGQIHAVCVHLGLLKTHRRRQMQMLCELVRQDMPAQARVVVAGDFNDWRRRAHDVLEQGAGLQEVFVQAHGKAARTFPAHLPLLRLDRIYVANARSHRPLSLPRKPWSHLSDHAPLAAEISW